MYLIGSIDITMYAIYCKIIVQLAQPTCVLLHQAMRASSMEKEDAGQGKWEVEFRDIKDAPEETVDG